MAIAFRGQFYFAAEGHSYFVREGQRRLPSGVKRARLFHLATVVTKEQFSLLCLLGQVLR